MSPFLKSGQILASDHSLGISPVQIDCCKRCANIGRTPKSVANYFRTLGWSSSGNKALDGFNPFCHTVLCINNFVPDPEVGFGRVPF